MAWPSAGSLAVTNGNVNIVGTSTLFLAAFPGDALVIRQSGNLYILQIDTITDNTHMAAVAADTFQGTTGSIAQGNWEILPCSPLRNTTATITNQFANIIATYGSVLSLTASDNTVTLNKAASANNAAFIFNTANVGMARVGCVGDNNFHLQVNLNGGGFSDALLANQITGLVTVAGDPTAALGIATKQYVDGTAQAHGARFAANGNVNITNPGTSSFDGGTAANGDVILLLGQTTPSQVGPWTFNGSGIAMTRPAWWTTAYVKSGASIYVQEGNTNVGTWVLTTANPIIIDTTAVTFVLKNAANPTASVGLSTVNGSASSYMRSDGAPALSQAIAPTWTGRHSWLIASTIASGASAVLDDFKIAAATTTVTGTTGITTAKGFNKVSIYKPTITDSSAITITNAAALYIEDAPAVGGLATITNPYALWVGSGNVRIGSCAAAGLAAFDANGVISSTNNPIVTGVSKSAQIWQSARNSISVAGTTPAGIASSTLGMLGIGATLKLTPSFSGRVKITLYGNAGNSAGNSLITILPYFGTGSAPANGVATTGTFIGTGVVCPIPSGFALSNVSIAEEVTGLTLGTQYWFDIAISRSSSGTGTLQISRITVEEF